MWIPSKLLDWLHVSKDTVDDLRKEVSMLRQERDLIQKEHLSTQATMDWMRIRLNQLEAERAGLLEKAYNIKLPVPEIVRSASVPFLGLGGTSYVGTAGAPGGLAHPKDPASSPFNSLFEHVDDEQARKLGISDLLS